MAGNADNLLLKVGDPGSATTLDDNYTAGDNSITVVSTSNWTSTGEGVIFAMDTVTLVDGVEVQDAGSYNEFEGTVASSTSITNVDWVRGSGDTSYTAGSTTRVYIPVSAERENRIVDWGSAEHSEVDGTHTDITATSITATTGTFTNLSVAGVSNDGWTTTGGTHSVSTGYNSGNRSFEIATSTDISSFVSEGMRYRVTRNTTPPTQCADLEASSSHYASITDAAQTGLDLTGDLSIEAWVKLESYTAGAIVSKYQTSGNQRSYILETTSSGTINARFSDDGTSTNSATHTTYQSLPLNKWVHIAMTYDASTNTPVFYIDGVSVPFDSSTLGTVNSVYDSTTPITIGYLQYSSDYLDGKLADVRVWSDIRTATEIQDNMYAYPSDTTGLVGHWKLAGDFTDASSNSNDLTAQNSAVATATDNPWNATEYGIITNVTASTIQVFCAEGYGIPNETLTAPFYSTQSAPYGFPRDKGKWSVSSLYKGSSMAGSGATASSWYTTNQQITVPIGSWSVGYVGYFSVTTEATGSVDGFCTLSSSTSSETDIESTGGIGLNQVASPGRLYVDVDRRMSKTISAQDEYYLLVKTETGSMNEMRFVNTYTPTVITAECAYL